MLANMTYDDLLALPRGTRVRLLDGRVGFISSWHHRSESITVRFDGTGENPLRAAELRPATDGSLEQVASGDPDHAHP
jgi:hypothetical protein